MTFIYGLFDKANVCHYVGRTINPKKRSADHSLTTFPKRNFELRILSSAKSDYRASNEERMFIRFYVERGEAKLNKNVPRSTYKHNPKPRFISEISDKSIGEKIEVGKNFTVSDAKTRARVLVAARFLTKITTRKNEAGGFNIIFL